MERKCRDQNASSSRTQREEKHMRTEEVKSLPSLEIAFWLFPCAMKLVPSTFNEQGVLVELDDLVG